MGEYALHVDHLSVTFHTEAGSVEAVRDVSLALKKGEILALAGESGCGKSVLCRSLVKLLPAYAAITLRSMIRTLQRIQIHKCRPCAAKPLPWSFKTR